MNKKIKNLFLAGAVLVGLAGVSVSCTDYSKDIDELRDENAELSKTVTELQEKLKSGISITSVTPTTGGFVIVFSDNQTYTIANGQSGTSGKDGSDGKDGKDGKDGGYYTPGPDGYWYFHKDSTDTAGTKTEIKCLSAGTGSVTAELSADGRTLTLKGVTGAAGDIVLNLKSDLTSLVFVPDLYVDGIESAEYLYAKYDVKKLALENTSKKAGEVLATEYTYYIDGASTTTAHVLNGYWKFGYDVAASGSKAKFLNPASSVITYKMNPSSADVNASTPLEFISRDAVSRSSVQAPEAEFVGTENGELKVGLSAKGLEQVLTSAQLGDYNEADKICVFALQATVAGSDGKDTTVTSDFARLVTEKLTFNHLAFKNSLESPLYTSIENVFKNAPSVTVKYDGSVDLADYVTTHFYVGGASSTCYDYATEYPDNDYKVTYEYEGVDYLVGSTLTSETQHMYLDGSVLTPCGVTDAGLRDSGKAAGREAVGRCPVVRVVMKVDGNIVLVGFVKVEIVSETADDKIAEPFGDWTYRFDEASFNYATWAQIENKVIAISGLSKAEFVTTYELAENSTGRFDGEAIQYIQTTDGFEPLPYYDETSEDTIYPYGEVAEIDPSATSGATTNVIIWQLNAYDMLRIYALDGHKVTIWVKFTPKNTAVKYGDIYVPLTAVVEKPVATVSKALNLWYNNGAYAVFSVKEPTSSKEVLSVTQPQWVSSLNSVWSNTLPFFNFGTDYDETLNSSVNDGSCYYYYFAPEQPRFVIGDYTYQLFATVNDAIPASYRLKDLGDNDVPKKGNVTNAAIKDYVLANGIDADEGIFNNQNLYCARILTSKATADWTKWNLEGTAGDYATEKVATIYLNMVTYNNGDIAKVLLNAYPSLKSDRSDAALYANIGVVPYLEAGTSNIALPVDGAINEFHFLRPINVTGVADADHVFTDGISSSLDLFDLFKFTDWRGKDFCEEKNEGTAEAPSYTYPNLYLYKYYGINSVWADLCCATTDYDGGTLGTSKLSAQTDDIVLEYKEYPSGWNWVKTDDGGKTHHSEFTLTDNWTNSQEALRNLFLGITYKNTGARIASPFTIRIPVTFTYTWGVVSSYVDVTVKPSNS